METVPTSARSWSNFQLCRDLLEISAPGPTCVRSQAGWYSTVNRLFRDRWECPSIQQSRKNLSCVQLMTKRKATQGHLVAMGNHQTTQRSPRISKLQAAQALESFMELYLTPLQISHCVWRQAEVRVTCSPWIGTGDPGHLLGHTWQVTVKPSEAKSKGNRYIL